MIDKKRSIGLAAKEIGVQEHVIRFWETQFTDIITPTIGAGGRRYYYNKDIDILLTIKKYLYEDGYTIKGLQNLLLKNQFTKQYKNVDNFKQNNQLNNYINDYNITNTEIINNKNKNFNVFYEKKNNKNIVYDKFNENNYIQENLDINIKNILISFNINLKKFATKLESI